eukprot:TRINITY_DN1002_c0_g1_i3.p1 TRINITY_DN1002_c0_g1~~TRINITY_DN1002_c0_g1_i3.p1  ORF type:complete len:216 (-),score=42.16 TRINITY_DN1002_c0_g1_i3:143-790(-)
MGKEGVDGSVYVEHGANKVMVSISGPCEAKTKHEQGTIQCNYTTANFAKTQHKVESGRSKQVTELETHIVNIFKEIVILELFQNSTINIDIDVISADGGIKCTAINAVSLALLDAGIPMKDFVVACSAIYLQRTVLIDANHDEERGKGPLLTIAMTPRDGKVIHMNMVSRVPVPIFNNMLDMAVEGCRIFEDYMKTESRSRTLAMLETQGKLSTR